MAVLKLRIAVILTAYTHCLELRALASRWIEFSLTPTTVDKTRHIVEEKEDCNRDRTALTGKLHAVNKGKCHGNCTGYSYFSNSGL